MTRRSDRGKSMTTTVKHFFFFTLNSVITLIYFFRFHIHHFSRLPAVVSGISSTLVSVEILFFFTAFTDIRNIPHVYHIGRVKCALVYYSCIEDGARFCKALDKVYREFWTMNIFVGKNAICPRYILCNSLGRINIADYIFQNKINVLKKWSMPYIFKLRSNN